MSGRKLLTAAEVCKTLGFKQPRLSKMVRAGCPVARKGKTARGRPKYFFRLKDVRNWIGGNTRTGSLQHDTGPAVSAGSHKALSGNDASRHVEADASYDGSDTWESTLDRCRKAERVAFNHWVRCVDAERKGEGDASSTKAANYVWIQTFDALRKAEADAAKIEQSRGEVMPRSEHERIFFDAYGKVANAMRNFAKKYASKVATKKKVVDCYKILTAGIEECMREAQRELNKIQEKKR